MFQSGVCWLGILMYAWETSCASDVETSGDDFSSITTSIARSILVDGTVSFIKDSIRDLNITLLLCSAEAQLLWTSDQPLSEYLHFCYNQVCDHTGKHECGRTMMLPQPAPAFCTKLKFLPESQVFPQRVLQQYEGCYEEDPRYHLEPLFKQRFKHPCWPDLSGLNLAWQFATCCVQFGGNREGGSNCFQDMTFFVGFCCSIAVDNGNDNMIPWGTYELPHLIVRFRQFAVTVHQSASMKYPQSIPTTLWKGGIVLARWIDACVGSGWRDRLVLETAAGVGLPSLIAALHGANVTVTDASAHAIQIIRHNFESNGLTGAYRAFKRRWQEKLQERFDVVLFSAPTDKKGQLTTHGLQSLSTFVVSGLRRCGLVVAVSRIDDNAVSFKPSLEHIAKTSLLTQVVNLWTFPGCTASALIGINSYCWPAGHFEHFKPQFSSTVD